MITIIQAMIFSAIYALNCAVLRSPRRPNARSVIRPNRSRWVNYGTEKAVSGFPGFDDSACSPNRTAITSADAVAILKSKGIITNPDIWYKGTWTDNDFKELIIKTAKHLLGESKI